MDEKQYELTEQIRKELHDMVDKQIDDLQMRLRYGKPKVRTEMEMPLLMMPAYFKGKKPSAIVYPDGTEVYVSTWRQLARHLLSGCAEDEVMRERLHRMCGHIYGRDRLLLSDSGEDMDAPIEFYPNMFFEGKFDTESLLKVITDRIFKPIGYNYGRIQLRVYNPALMALTSEQPNVLEPPEDEDGEEQEEGFGMQMM